MLILKKTNFYNPPPCSTWNFLFFIVILFLLNGCNEKDPKPELKDLIYQDMQAQQSEAIKALADIQKKVDEAKKVLEESKVQTGEIKRNTKRYDDLIAAKVKVEQQIMFWKIRVFDRLKFVRNKANKMSKEEWADFSSKEYQVYLSEKKLRQAKNSWDLKQRFKDSGFSYNPILMGEELRAPAKEAPKSGGH